MRNFRYEVDDGKFIYETDDIGRVKTAIINDLQINPRQRQEDWQAKAKVLKNGVTTPPVDDGGHMFRAQWGGPSEQINYFPQNHIENSNARDGEWFKMEKAISDMKEADPSLEINIEMNFNFDDPDRPHRPTSIDVEVYINGELHELSKEYPNPL